MISFCIIKAGNRSDHAVQAVIHYVQNQFSEQTHHFDRIHIKSEGIYFIGIRPNSENSGVRASCFHDDRIISCFYGEIDDGDDRPAQSIARIYQCMGVDGLAELDGCYGAVLYDRVSKELILGGDAIGQRGLRYVLQDDLLLISPHDIVLAATGVIPVSVDPASFAAICLFGWSVGGSSLVSAIRSVPPGSLVVLREDASPRLLPHPLFAACEQRRGSIAELPQIRERMIEAARGYLARHIADLPRLDVELSAGFDSRATLAAAISVVDRDRLNSFSDGPPGSIDVDVAREVAGRLGIAHRGGLPAEHSVDERHRYVEIMALETNGDASALIGMTNRIAPPPPSLCGDGGEIFRGYYYPFFQAADRAPATGVAIASALWKRSKRGGIGLQPGVEQGVRKRLADRAEWLAGIAASEIDGLDLLFILEHFAVRNQKLRRMTNALNRRGPFYSRAVIRHFLTLPVPRGKHAQLHQMLIQRYAPQTLSIPINRLHRLNLLLGNAFQRKLGKALVSSEMIRRRLVRRLLKVRRNVVPLDELRSQRFQHLLADKWAKLLLTEESGSMAAFGREAVEKLLADARANDPAAVKAAGALITAELFIAHARRAHAMGRLWATGKTPA